MGSHLTLSSLVFSVLSLSRWGTGAQRGDVACPESHSRTALEAESVTLSLVSCLLLHSLQREHTSPPRPRAQLSSKAQGGGDRGWGAEASDAGPEQVCKGLPPLLLESPSYPLYLMEPVQDPLVHLRGGGSKHRSAGLCMLNTRGPAGGRLAGGHPGAPRARCVRSFPLLIASLASLPHPRCSRLSPLTPSCPGGFPRALPQVPA